MGVPDRFMTGSCRRRLRIGYRKSEAYNETTRKVQRLSVRVSYGIDCRSGKCDKRSDH